MADFTDFPEREYNVFQLFRSFKPPFYVRTLSGIYDEVEDLCYSAGQVYVILHKLKIKSVIATVRGVNFKIPLDYNGQFSLVGQSQSGPLTMREIMETVTPQNLPREVRLSNSTRKHGNHFLEMLDKIGRGIRTCNLKLSQEILDEYFIGRSPGGKLMMLFPSNAIMNFQVRKTNIQDVQHLRFNLKELKYDIFVVDANIPDAKFLTTEEAVYSSPKRPPKPAPSVRRKVSPASAAPENQMQFQRGKRESVKEFVTHSFKTGGPILLSSQPPPPPPKKSLKDTWRKKPPPIPVPYHYPSDEEKDTDEEFDDKVSGRTTSPRGFPVFPPPSPLSPSGRQRANTPPLHPYPGGGCDTDNEFDARMSGAVGNIIEPTDELGSDEYEHVEPPPDDFQSSLPIHTESPGSANTPDSPNRSKSFELHKIRLQLNEQIRKFRKFRKKKRSVDRAGYMADGELTEDPYAEQKQDQRATKTQTRRRNDPLPPPLTSGPSSVSMQSSLPPPPPPSSHRPWFSSQLSDSDSDSLAEYDKIDDEIPIQPTKGPRLPSKAAKVSLPQTPRVADEGSTNPYPHASVTSGHPGNVAVVKPAQKQQPPGAGAADEFPRALCNLGVEALAQNLRKLKIPEKTVQIFREAQIDGQLFVDLNGGILDELGVSELYKLKIIKFKNGWRPNLS